MKTFLAVFTGTPASMATWNDLSEAERSKRQKEGIAAWHAWADKHKGAIAEMGAPLGKTKRITPSGIADIKNNMTAYTVVNAESHEAAAKLFVNHPHFTIFPGDGVEVMECLSIPTM
jgi:hypothetical protein